MKSFRRRPSSRLIITGMLVIAATPIALTGPVAVGAGDRSEIRLLSVGSALAGGMLNDILAEFENQSGYDVIVTPAAIDIFDRARAGEADIVISHMGFDGIQDFVLDKRGEWPAAILSDSVVFLIPADDPAGVRGAVDPFEAFASIADRQLPFVVNNLDETLYVTDTLWNAVGRPDPGQWFIDLGQSGPPAVREAERRGGYTIWGLHPFLNLRQQQGADLEPVVFNDSFLQRLVVSVVVRHPPGQVNREGALSLQEYLTAPATQAEIRAFRLPGIEAPVFLPAGNQNDN